MRCLGYPGFVKLGCSDISGDLSRHEFLVHVDIPFRQTAGLFGAFQGGYPQRLDQIR